MLESEENGDVDLVVAAVDGSAGLEVESAEVLEPADDDLEADDDEE